MINNYDGIIALVDAGNQMGLSNTIKRDYGIPLDFTSVQKNLDEAVKYAATSTLAYVGQTVSVGGKLYIISDTASGTKYVIEGKAYDNYLVEIVADAYSKADADKKFLLQEDYEKYDNTALTESIDKIEEIIGNDESGLIQQVAENTVAIESTNQQLGTLKLSVKEKDGVQYITLGNDEGTVNAEVAVSDFIQTYTAGTGLSIGKDNTINIDSINVNKLTQDDGEFIILYGGNADSNFNTQNIL